MSRERLPWVLALAYAALFTFLGAVKYSVHRNLVDFGIFTQTIASAFGCFCNPIEGDHFAFHYSPILFVAAAILRVAHAPLALIALQALAGALVIPAVYGLVRRCSDQRIAALSAIVVALYPPLAGLTFNDFHENGFAPAAVAWTVWAFEAGRLPLMLLFAVCAIAVKEDQAIFMAIAGAAAAVRFRGTSPGRYAALVAILGVVAATAFFGFIQPHHTVSAHWAPQRFYAWTADDLRALVPRGMIERLGFFVLAFLPLLFLPFRARVMWLAAAPLAEVLFSRMSTTYTMGSHYAGAWLGWVLVAFAFAVRKLPHERMRVVLYWCIGLCVVELAVANPLHPGLNLHKPAARDAALDRVLATVPANVSIATQEEAYTHLALDNPSANLLPETPDVTPEACIILIDRDYPESARLEEYGAALQQLVAHGMYRLDRREGGIEIYKRSDCR